jgi:hypothetical protein
MYLCSVSQMKGISQIPLRRWEWNADVVECHEQQLQFCISNNNLEGTLAYGSKPVSSKRWRPIFS